MPGPVPGAAVRIDLRIGGLACFRGPAWGVAARGRPPRGKEVSLLAPQAAADHRLGAQALVGRVWVKLPAARQG